MLQSTYEPNLRSVSQTSTTLWAIMYKCCAQSNNSAFYIWGTEYIPTVINYCMQGFISYHLRKIITYRTKTYIPPVCCTGIIKVSSNTKNKAMGVKQMYSLCSWQVWRNERQKHLLCCIVRHPQAPAESVLPNLSNLIPLLELTEVNK